MLVGLHLVKGAADLFAILHLPKDLGEAIDTMAQAPLLGFFLIGLACLGFLIWDSFVGTKVSWPARRVSLEDAAREMYEAAESADVLDLTTSASSSPETKLSHFKTILVKDDDAELYGIKPPSTQSRLIPKNELARGDLFLLDDNNLHHPSPSRVVYTDLSLKRSVLRRLTKKFFDVYVPEARQLSR
jgi:hypothetical protein